MQTFNLRNLTFLTWRSIYLNIKEASRPIALRFWDSHLERFKHFRERLHEENYYSGGNMGFSDRAQKPPDMRTRALATVSCIPAFRFSKWRRTNQNLTRHYGRCQAAVLALRIFQHR